MLSEQAKKEIQKIRDEVPDPQSALLPALYLAQREYGGWLPEQALDEVAAVMGLPAAQVAGMASFYTMLNKQPVGRHLVQVCTNITCSLLGAQRLVEVVGRKLGIGVGETTPDGKFTLLEVECLGSCGTAPAMQVDDRYYENLTEETIGRVLDSLRRGS